MRQALGQALRPGGEILTRHLLDVADAPLGSLVLDAGCGCGATLGLVQEYGLRSVGLDLAPDFLDEAKAARAPLLRADVGSLPLRTASLDLVLCECVWNLADKPRALAEIYRVLRPGGQLLMSDIFARGQDSDKWPLRCCFAQATSLDLVRQQVSSAGFTIELLEDHSPLLARVAADFVFRHGSLHGFWQAVTGDADLATAACTASRQSRPGLFALVARR